MDEAKRGTNPALPDTDGDRLGDGAEVSTGTDPNDPDSDADGYLDGDEVAAGADPNDAASVIYQGGWPYFSDKDSLEIDVADPPADGERFARFQLTDQFGDTVDIYDFLGGDAVVMVNVTSMTCEPCRSLAEHMTGVDNQIGEIAPSFRQLVNDGDVTLITVISAGAQTELPTLEDAETWYNTWPHELVPVLTDADQALWRYAGDGTFPTAWLLDPNGDVLEVAEGYSAEPKVLIWIEENLGTGQAGPTP